MAASFLDTNVLVYFASGDPAKAHRAVSGLDCAALRKAVFRPAVVHPMIKPSDLPPEQDRAGSELPLHDKNDQDRLRLRWVLPLVRHRAGQPGCSAEALGTGIGGRELKRALLAAYHSNMQNPGDHGVLAAAAESVGLDGDAARDVLTSGRYAAEVRDAEKKWQRAGITGVPAVVINDRYLITGAQPPEAFEQAMRKAAAEIA